MGTPSGPLPQRRLDRVPPPFPSRLNGGTPIETGWGYPPLAGQDGVLPQEDRAAEQILAMQQVLCLLHSRRRTFLFSRLLQTDFTLVIPLTVTLNINLTQFANLLT